MGGCWGAEDKLEVQLRRAGQVVKVKEFASVVVFIISFGLVVSRSASSTRGSRPSSMVINKEVMEDSVCQVNLAEEEEVAKSSTCGELRGLQGSGGLDQRHECPVAL